MKFNTAYYHENNLGFNLNWDVNKNEETRKGIFEFEYTTYNMLRKDGDEFFVNIPLYENSSFPVVEGKLQIHFPEKLENNQLSYQLAGQ